MKTILQIVLGLIIVILAYLLYDSLMQPIRFRKEVNYRESLVVERLKQIRTLQVAYKDGYSQFTGSFDTLIDYYKTGTIITIKQTGSEDDSIAVAQGKVRRDTNRIAVKDSLFKEIPDFNIDSVRYVPLVGTQFKMAAVIFPSSSKVQIPLFEASVTNKEYLDGLDPQLIINKSDSEKSEKKFPGLKVGSIEMPNNNAGNWKGE